MRLFLRERVSNEPEHNFAWAHPWHPDRGGLFLVPDLWAADLVAGHRLFPERICQLAGRAVLDRGRADGDLYVWQRGPARAGTFVRGAALQDPGAQHNSVHLWRD